MGLTKLEEIQESKAKEYGFKSFKDLEKSEYGSDPHWNVREDIAYTYVEYLEYQTQELKLSLESYKLAHDILIEQNAELVSILDEILNGTYSLPQGKVQKAKELLTKYNNLNHDSKR